MHQCVPALQIFTKPGERKGRSGRRGGSFHHFSIQCSDSPVLSPPAPLGSDLPALETIQRRRHIGSINLLYSLKPPCCGGGSLLGITVQQNCYSNSFDIPVDFFLFCSWWCVGCTPRCFSQPPRSLARFPPP